MSIKKVGKLTALAILLVCAFAGSLYYLVPDVQPVKSIAFALGPSSMGSRVNSSVYSLGTVMNVTFQNGTNWEISGYPNIAKEFNFTDMTGIIIMPLPVFGGGGLDLGENYVIALKYAFDWKIYTSLAGENPIDLGLLDVVNYTFSHYSANWNPPPGYLSPIYPLNYTLQVNTTGYWAIGMPPPFYGPWTWQIDAARIQNLISNATNPVEVNFDIDITINLYYKITTASATQSGFASVSWAGRWAKLELFHDSDQLLGFRYADTDISLEMMAS